MDNKQNWTTVIKPKGKLLDLKLKEVWKYKGLIWLFVKRDITTRYKQTVLGPLWLFISPILTTLVSTFVFGTIANFQGSVGIPYFLFFFAGTTCWSYFSGALSSTSSTFIGNAGIFGKVYFPRLISPIATIVGALFNFSMQLLMCIVFMIYCSATGAPIYPQFHLLWIIPLLILEMAILGLGIGIILSSITTKYRDLANVIGLFVSFWQYLTPIIYSFKMLSEPNPTFKAIVFNPWAELNLSTMTSVMLINPMTAVVEAFKYILLGPEGGQLMILPLLLGFAFSLVVLFLGMILFNKVEKTFMDTV